MKRILFEKIEKIIGTPFVENELENGSVYFENEEDLRADYRIQFTTYDVVNYVYGVLCMKILKINKNS